MPCSLPPTRSLLFASCHCPWISPGPFSHYPSLHNSPPAGESWLGHKRWIIVSEGINLRHPDSSLRGTDNLVKQTYSRAKFFPLLRSIQQNNYWVLTMCTMMLFWILYPYSWSLNFLILSFSYAYTVLFKTIYWWPVLCQALCRNFLPFCILFYSWGRITLRVENSRF